jgi:Secretion system C-terminal sorting domain/SprB repeat
MPSVRTQNTYLLFHIYYFIFTISYLLFHILIPTLSIMKTKQFFILLVVLLGFAVKGVAQCTVSISLSNPELTCVNTTTTLTASSGFAAYQWSNAVSSGNTVTNQAGTYTVTATASNGCTAIATVNVAQNTTPPIAIAGPDQTIRCNMSSVDIGIISPAPNVSYVWSVPNNTSYITVISPGTYTVTVTDISNGCTGTDEVMVFEDRVIPFVGISSPSMLTCANPTATLNAFSGANSIYTWSPNVAFSVGSNATINYPGTYSVTVTNPSNGCTASVVVSASSDINPPFVNIISSSTILTCATPTTTISANGASSYIWSNGANTPSITVSQGGTYAVTATNMTNGCTNTASIVIAQDTVQPFISLSSNISVFNCGTITAILTATGGSIYIWSNNVLSSNGGTATVNQATTYTVTATNTSNGCTASATIALGSVVPINVNAAITSVTCSSGADGSIQLAVSGDNPPFAFSWNSGAFGSMVNGLSGGLHTVTITDAVGCQLVKSFFVNAPAPINISFQTTNVFCNGGATGATIVNAVGSTPIFSYFLGGLSISNTTGVFTGLNAGIYNIIVTDLDGCTTSASTTISNVSSIVISRNASLTCEMPSINIGTAANPNIVNSAGSYVVLLSSVGGCDSTLYYNITNNIASPCVFPGDTNNDGTADNTDLLPIALSNALTGNARLNATTQWTAQTAQDWATNIPNTTTNRKHADCDGNGTILANDTLVILQNYGQVHQRGVMQTTNLNDPPISCLFASDTVQNTVFPYRLKANVVVGSAAIPAQGVHGLAFTINYDPTVASSAYINLKNLSWLGAANELFHIQHDDGQGHLDVAISRFDGQSRNGAGIVAECGFVIIDNIIGRGANSIAYPFDITVSDIKAINPQNATLPMNGVATRTVLNNMVLATNANPLAANIRISPNPTHDILNIQTNAIAINRLTLTNMLGQVLLTQNADVRGMATTRVATTLSLSLADLPQGTYFITIETPEGRLTQKVVKL